MDAQAEKIQNMLQEKEKYKKTLQEDRGDGSNCCWTQISRHNVGGHGTTYIGRKVAGFEKVIDYIDYVFKKNQVVSVDVVCKFFCDNKCVDISSHQC